MNFNLMNDSLADFFNVFIAPHLINFILTPLNGQLLPTLFLSSILTHKFDGEKISIYVQNKGGVGEVLLKIRTKSQYQSHSSLRDSPQIYTEGH